MLDDDEVNQKEIVFYLSACLNISIEAADHSGKDIQEDDTNLKVIYDMLSTLLYLKKKDPDENMQ